MERAVLLFFILALCHSGVRVVAQDIVLKRIEPDPGQLPCPQQTVKYRCQIIEPASTLTWTLPTGDLLEFSIAREVGEIRNSSNDVYSANLTSKMEDTDPDSDRFFFSSTLLILETVNGSNITCAGATVPDTVEDSAVIILSSPPDPPSGLEYELIETSVDLKWSRPSHTGGVPLMNYSLTASSSDGTLSVSDSREMVSYTTPGLVYGVIEVTAINYCGQQSQPDSLNISAEAPPDFMEGISVYLNCQADSSEWTVNWLYEAMEAGVVYPEVDIEVVVTCTEVPGNTECPETLGICSSVTAIDTSCTVDLTRGMYNISITRTNVMGSQKVTDSVDTRRVIVEDDGLDDKDELSVTVSINDACEDGEYPVTVMFGTVLLTSSGGCNIQRNVSGQVPLLPGQPSTTFSVKTSSITLGSDEEYCYIVFLRGVTVITVRGGDPGFPVGAIVGIVIGIAGVSVLVILIVIVVVIKKKQKGTERETNQNPDTIQRSAHPETGEMYTMVDLKKRNRELEQVGATALYQDPSTIQHQEGPSGDVYAMPQKTGKKKKEKEAEAEVEDMSEEQKAALYSVPDRKGQKSKSEGLQYARLDIQPSVKQAPPSKGSTYVDIRY